MLLVSSAMPNIRRSPGLTLCFTFMHSKQYCLLFCRNDVMLKKSGNGLIRIYKSTVDVQSYNIALRNTIKKLCYRALLPQVNNYRMCSQMSDVCIKSSKMP